MPRSRKRYKLFLFAILYVNIGFSTAGADELSLKSYSEAYIDALSVSDYGSAAELLHYPESMVGVERNKELQAMIRSIEVMVEELGTIKNVNLGAAGAFLSVFIMAGSLDYWSGKFDGLTLTYRVSFSKEGEGYLFFRFPLIQKKFVLRAVEYGLPASNPRAVPTLRRIFHRLAAID